MDSNGAIEIVYPNNNNNNNNNIIIIIIIIKWKKNQMGQGASSGGQEHAIERFYFIFPTFRFLLRSTEIGPQVFIGAEGKVDIHDENYA